MLADPSREADGVVAEDKAGALSDCANVRFGNLALAGGAMDIISFRRDNHLLLLSFEFARDNAEVEVRKDLRDAVSVEENDFCLGFRHCEGQLHYTSLIISLPVIGSSLLTSTFF